ncbi:MAG: hypothetical protein LQ350_003424 [Teloschistes chrysophthalmus]|nr:MAG: hypothetical protein LQ350_003424 [Niorma chrysophthalma]
MADHQPPLQDRLCPAQGAHASYQNGAPSKPFVADDDIPTELDEPPDDLIHFPRDSPSKTHFSPKSKLLSSSMAHSRKTSLLTQAFSISPDSAPNSDADTPHLTSDGGLSSPARTNSPSPPLPASHPSALETITSHNNLPTDDKTYRLSVSPSTGTKNANSARETNVEVGLGRRRCIKFACGRQAADPPKDLQATTAEMPQREAPPNSQKRPCMLKFVCPMKPLPTHDASRPSKENPSNNSIGHQSSNAIRVVPTPSPKGTHLDPIQPVSQIDCLRENSTPRTSERAGESHPFNRINLEGSEATRFHEFAGPYNGEDEWVHEQTAYRRKMTVNDTLQKENAIRKIGEEAEEEAIDEENAVDEEDEYDEMVGLSHDTSSEEDMSDAGNETDDEEGFAESDDESEMGSDFHFWTPSLTTAATSADHLEHVRPRGPRTFSNSSIDSMTNVNDTGNAPPRTPRRAPKVYRAGPLKMRPGTPDLPDSTDFVCGTLDEDRPLEAAYMSCLEERRRSKRRTIPQDIDPTFPASELELDNDDKDNAGLVHASDEPVWITGKPDRSDGEQGQPQRKPLSRRSTKSPMPSPKRMRSPPPQRRSIVHRSPPPPALALHPPGSSSSISSATEDDTQPATVGSSWISNTTRRPPKMIACHLPRRVHPTHAASLPRTPNPFWAPSGQWPQESVRAASMKSRILDVRSRGPIDIVTGLEKKRQRRKEKLWRQHGRNGAAKDKERHCQPGKGAERMRELGLEMAGKNKAYLPQVQLMLSI